MWNLAHMRVLGLLNTMIPWLWQYVIYYWNAAKQISPPWLHLTNITRLSGVPRAAPCAIRAFCARMAHPEWLECARMAQRTFCWFQKCQSQVSTTTRSASKWQFCWASLKSIFIHCHWFTHSPSISLFTPLFIYPSFPPSPPSIHSFIHSFIKIRSHLFTYWE